MILRFQVLSEWNFTLVHVLHSSLTQTLSSIHARIPALLIVTALQWSHDCCVPAVTITITPLLWGPSLAQPWDLGVSWGGRSLLGSERTARSANSSLQQRPGHKPLLSAYEAVNFVQAKNVFWDNWGLALKGFGKHWCLTFHMSPGQLWHPSVRCCSVPALPGAIRQLRPLLPSEMSVFPQHSLAAEKKGIFTLFWWYLHLLEYFNFFCFSFRKEMW